MGAAPSELPGSLQNFSRLSKRYVPFGTRSLQNSKAAPEKIETVRTMFLGTC